MVIQMNRLYRLVLVSLVTFILIISVSLFYYYEPSITGYASSFSFFKIPASSVKLQQQTIQNALKVNPEAINPYGNKPVNCSDSGIGNVTVKYSPRFNFLKKPATTTKTFSDMCSDNDSLIHYYCEGNDYASVKKLCENGCGGGACLKTKAHTQINVKKLNFVQSNYSLCLSLADHNNEDEKRINMVFIGVGYENFSDIKNIVDAFVDYDGKGNGMFSVDPFKKDINKFNIWLVEDIFYEKDHEEFLRTQHNCSEFAKKDVMEMALTQCPLLKNTAIVVALNRYPSATRAHLLSKYSIDEPEVWIHVYKDYNDNFILVNQLSGNSNYDLDYLDDTMLMMAYSPYFLHEMGHVFGLYDEYVDFPSDVMPFTDSYLENCFMANSEVECRANSPWKDFIGQGIGYLKVDCYQGCMKYGKGVYRPTLRSLMGAAQGMYYSPSSENGSVVYFEEDINYGLYNQYVIEEMINSKLAENE